jgi:hypothetical protein
MNDPASAREPVAAVAARKRVTIDLGWRLRTRLILTSFVLLIGIGIPVLGMLFEAHGHTLVCEPADKQCVLTEHYLFEDKQVQIGFAGIADLGFDTGGVDEDGNPGTARILVLRMSGGNIIAVAPDRPSTARGVSYKKLRKTVRGGPDRYEHYAAVNPWTRGGPVFALWFALGLALAARLQWRPVARWDPGARTLTLEQLRWPLPTRVLEREADPLEKVVLDASGRVGVVDVTGEATHLETLSGDNDAQLAKAQELADAFGVPLEKADRLVGVGTSAQSSS